MGTEPEIKMDWIGLVSLYDVQVVLNIRNRPHIYSVFIIVFAYQCIIALPPVGKRSLLMNVVVHVCVCL